MNDYEIIQNCQLEWDKRRGVIYVHNKDTGHTLLRICKLPTNPRWGTLTEGQIDITGPFDHISLPSE